MFLIEIELQKLKSNGNVKFNLNSKIQSMKVKINKMQ